MVEREENGALAGFWMCCACGEIVGRYKKRRTDGYRFVPEKHHWVSPVTGKIISEYI